MLGIELEAKTNSVTKTHKEEDEALQRVVRNKCQTGGHLALDRRVSKWRPCFRLKRTRLFIYI